ncbi:hypothetical protein CU669_18930 [Paramagnetospirillum kuznetsovii]|uniref:Uncharacterized protein n=1 Tax=Paramagnetospirillum kuznetsovii TaxID=2053833 RepID=A0A364NTE3_9PROT|nr:hypothetical protein [Paramagnetospirillum kuznetsovii]RAU20351.1 hypothetical protein CU669_18930 [Paramagnetospirillum kuznetsovii]
MTNPTSKSVAKTEQVGLGSLLIGTGLTVASLILVPALSQSIGVGPSLTGALRVVLMKAAARV